MNLLLAVLAVTRGVATAPSEVPASAPRALTVLLGVDYGALQGCRYYDRCGAPLGMGLRFSLSVLPRGLVARLDDSLVLDLGLDARLMAGRQLGGGVIPLVELRWVWQLFTPLGAYVKAGLGMGVFPDQVSPVRAHYDLAAGLIIATTARLSVRVEAGWSGARAGLAWAF